MNARKIYFIECGRGRSLFGCGDGARVFGFGSKQKALYVAKHVAYEGSDVEEIVDGRRYLVRTHYNEMNEISGANKRKMIIVRRKLYDVIWCCKVNGVGLELVNHIDERDDGDIELSCNRILKRNRIVNESNAIDIGDYANMMYNLEFLYKM